MKITTLNIQAAGLPRARRLATWLSGHDADVVILTEVSVGPGAAYILDQFRSAGWQVLASGGGDSDRGCVLLSRFLILPVASITNSVSLPWRCAAGRLETSPAVTVVGVYVPSNDRTPFKAARKRTFLSSLSAALVRVTAEGVRLIVGGDYNLITRDHQPPYAGVFDSSDYAFLDNLTAIGLIDAHRHLHPADQVHSWIGHRGHGYRYDYFHVAESFAPLLTHSAYLHQVREAKLSDHAGVSIELAITTNHLVKAGSALPVGADTLF